MERHDIVLERQILQDKIGLIQKFIDAIESWNKETKKLNEENMALILRKIDHEKIYIVDKPNFILCTTEIPKLTPYEIKNKILNANITRMVFQTVDIVFTDLYDMIDFINNNELTFIYAIFVTPKLGAFVENEYLFRGLGIGWTDMLTKYKGIKWR